MGWEAVIDRETNYLVFACNTVDRAFGPLIYFGHLEEEITELVDGFVEKYGDPRLLNHDEIHRLWGQYIDDDPTPCCHAHEHGLGKNEPCPKVADND